MMLKQVPILLLLGVMLPCWINAQNTSQKPNIIIFLADDAGYADFGFMGSPDMKTPNLDSLAANGVHFTDAHTTASACSPSRAGVLTGRYQQRFGHEQNKVGGDNGMDISELTLADLLKTVGYKTACFGKWHLGYTPEYHPNERGFDEFYGFITGHRSYFPSASQDQPGRHTALQRNGEYTTFDGYLTDVLGDQAIDFIDENKEDPFFIYLSYNAIHTPLHATEEDKALFPSGTRGTLAAMNYAMDRSIGNVINKLEEDGLLENTLIFFFSDNGGPIGQPHDNGPLRGSKGYVFEGGQRVAFTMYWKDKVPAGLKYDKLTSSLDVFATAMKAAGIDQTPGKPLDGVDLVPYVNNQLQTAPHDKLFWRISPWEAARVGDYKLIRATSAATGMYNLANDIGEIQELSQAEPNVFDNMKRELDLWNQEMVEQLWGGSMTTQEKKFFVYEDMIENRPIRLQGSATTSELKESLKYVQHYNDAIPRAHWKVTYTDSEEDAAHAADKVMDNDFGTYWTTGSDTSTSTHPHEIHIDLGDLYEVDGIRVSPRHDGWHDGMITDYEVYVSIDGEQWQNPVATGEWLVNTGDKEAHFTPKKGRYLRLVAQGSVPGSSATTIAELHAMGKLVSSPCACISCINFTEESLVSYDTRQDKPEEGTIEIQEDGATVKVTGNRWVRTDSLYEITPNTVLEFEFKSDSAGEIHGIGFDDNDVTTRAYMFAFFGEDADWGTTVPMIYNGSGDYAIYRIPVGEYYTGSMHLVFINDKDNGDPTNTSYFRRVRLYEAGAEASSATGHEIPTISTQIFPNPLPPQEVLRIVSNKDAQIQLLDKDGKIILDRKVEKTQEVDIKEELPSGIYFLKIISEKGIETKKLIID